MGVSKFVPIISTFLAMSTMVTSQSTAPECTSDVSDNVIAIITNSSYFDTCAANTTFNISSVLEVFNFSSANLLAFCSSDVCLSPIHELLQPLNCSIMYQGRLQNLSSEVEELHTLCHETLEETEANDDGVNGHSTDSSPNAVHSSDASFVVLTVGSVAFAAILAVVVA